jgi:hypothetical protein
MKLLLLYTHDYWLQPYLKNLDDAADAAGPVAVQGAVVALVHVEPADIAESDKRVTKAIKQLKWLAGKFETRRVVLHSFAHLAAERAEPLAAQQLLEQMAARLRSVDYTVQTSPFGYFNEFKLHVAGPSLAKVFVEI